MGIARTARVKRTFCIDTPEAVSLTALVSILATIRHYTSTRYHLIWYQINDTLQKDILITAYALAA